MPVSKNTGNECEWRRKVGDGCTGLPSSRKDFGFYSKCDKKSGKTAGRCREVPFVLIILPAE